jgi:hypothetical protein
MLEARAAATMSAQAPRPIQKDLAEDRQGYLDGLLRRSQLAAAAFYQFSQEQVDRIVRAMVLKGLESAQHLGFPAVMETRLGVLRR